MAEVRTGFDADGLCIMCKKGRTPEGHDPCIANLPGVRNACCGHGLDEAYLQFNDGRVLRFNSVCLEDGKRPNPNLPVGAQSTVWNFDHKLVAVWERVS